MPTGPAGTRLRSPSIGFDGGAMASDGVPWRAMALSAASGMVRRSSGSILVRRKPRTGDSSQHLPRGYKYARRSGGGEGGDGPPFQELHHARTRHRLLPGHAPLRRPDPRTRTAPKRHHRARPAPGTREGPDRTARHRGRRHQGLKAKLAAADKQGQAATQQGTELSAEIEKTKAALGEATKKGTDLAGEPREDQGLAGGSDEEGHGPGGRRGEDEGGPRRGDEAGPGRDPEDRRADEGGREAATGAASSPADAGAEDRGPGEGRDHEGARPPGPREGPRMEARRAEEADRGAAGGDPHAPRGHGEGRRSHRREVGGPRRPAPRPGEDAGR